MSFGYNYDPEGDSCISKTPPIVTITAAGESTFDVEYTHVKPEEADDSSDSSSSDSSMFGRRRREAGASATSCDGQGMVINSET